MTRLLIKKQLWEIFRAYFYDAKKNKKRSTVSTVLFFVLFAAIMLVLLGGIFAGMGIGMCFVLVAANLDWMYFAMFVLVAVLLGCFGSVFNTFSCLYLSKDNDLLLSMPIPIKTIMVSRLMTVYLMGLMYSGIVMLPGVIVYWILGRFTVGSVLGGLLLTFLVSVFVLVLSCALGWVVAKVSTKLKNKSFITVIIALVGFGLYYMVCFRAQEILEAFLNNAVAWGESIQGKVYPLYLIGSVGCGDIKGCILVTVVVALLFVLTWTLIEKSFLSITTATGKVSRVKFQKQALKQKSPKQALFFKELKRFTDSATYMLNCGLGVIFIVLLGGFFLIKGADLLGAIRQEMPFLAGAVAPIYAGALIMAITMNEMTVPSISLEGKNMWILRSLPIDTKEIITQKLNLQFVLTGIPTLLAGICGIIVMRDTPVEAILAMALELAYGFFYAVIGMFLGIKMVNLNWTNEGSVIKQSLNVAIGIFGGFFYGLAVILAAIPLTAFMGAIPYLILATVVTLALGGVTTWWLYTGGVREINSMAI